MNVNIESYRVFYYVAKHKSITKAASELFISQPAVSIAIRQLENQLGGELFVRNRHGVELSEEGEAIFEHIERAIGLLEQVETRFAQFRALEMGHISIGASDNICKRYLASYINKFSGKFPNITITLYNGATAKTISLLKNGKIDLGFVNYPITDNELTATPIIQLHDCFVAGAKYMHLAKKSNKIQELLKTPLILLAKGTNSRLAFDENIKQLKITCEPRVEVGSHDMMVDLAKMGIGIACVTEEYIQKELENRELYKLDVDVKFKARRLGFCTLKNTHISFGVKKFCDGLHNLEEVL